ncbi:dTDP-4-amino-4,6-dideoxygalactose transaminase [Pseudomonadota bacterium]
MRIPFNKPYMAGKELWYITEAHAKGQLSGDGEFTRRCSAWLEQRIGCDKALLTHSCTAALEMSAILSDLDPGDEVIMPSYTFVSTANAFVLRGAVPVFVDIRPDTLNLDESLLEAAITDRTRAVVPMHYAGVACEMDTIMEIATRRDLVVIEDAAQGIMSTYKGRPLGSIGQMGTLSFHETKNIISGEGGALLVNGEREAGRAEIIREKGTNRKAFFRGEVDKYSWVDIGSSFLPSDMIAAYLWAQMEEADAITKRRLMLWDNYHRELEALEEQGLLRRPVVPADCQHNAHMYYILLPSAEKRSTLIEQLKSKGIHSVFHYVPLHSSEMGRKIGRASGGLERTTDLASRLLRLPMWLGMEVHQEEIIQEIRAALE